MRDLLEEDPRQVCLAEQMPGVSRWQEVRARGLLSGPEGVPSGWGAECGRRVRQEKRLQTGMVLGLGSEKQGLGHVSDFPKILRRSQPGKRDSQGTTGSQADPTGSSGVSCMAEMAVHRGQGAGHQSVVYVLSAPGEWSGG